MRPELGLFLVVTSLTVPALAACGITRTPAPLVDAAAPPPGDRDGGGLGPIPASAPLPSPSALAQSAVEAVPGSRAGPVHDGHGSFSAPLDLPAGQCGRVVLAADGDIIAGAIDGAGARGGQVDAGSGGLVLVPPEGPVCQGAGGARSSSATVSLQVRGGANVRWTTVSR